jgi:tripartite-type tricarboxylate transporter receptor subunit TctC
MIAMASGGAQALPRPARPIRFVVPYPPGGSLDQMARALADKMKDGLGQPVQVESRPGAGGNPALLALMSGQTDLMFDNLANASGQIKADKVRPLAVTTLKRSSFAPELPTMAEADPRLRGFDLDIWLGTMAPAGVPKGVLDRLHAEIVKAMGNADMRECLSRMGAEPGGNSPRQFGEFIALEMAKYVRFVKLSGAKVD